MTGERQPVKTSLGLEENVEGALCYSLGWITGIVFLVVEKDSRFVRFHALQSIATFIPLTIASVFTSFIPYIGWILGMAVWGLTLVLWLILMLQAYQGKMYKLPYAGEFAESQLR
jgi:uncharacterized membrane protein